MSLHFVNHCIQFNLCECGVYFRIFKSRLVDSIFKLWVFSVDLDNFGSNFLNTLRHFLSEFLLYLMYLFLLSFIRSLVLSSTFPTCWWLLPWNRLFNFICRFVIVFVRRLWVVLQIVVLQVFFRHKQLWALLTFEVVCFVLARYFKQVFVCLHCFLLEFSFFAKHFVFIAACMDLLK